MSKHLNQRSYVGLVEFLVCVQLSQFLVLGGQHGFLGSFRRDCECGPTHRPRCRPADWDDREGRQHGADAQEELQAVRSAPEADRQLAGAAQDLRAQEVPGDEGAYRAARGRAAEVLHLGQQLPGPELPLSVGHGVEHRVSVQEGSERDRPVLEAHPPHYSRGQCSSSGKEIFFLLLVTLWMIIVIVRPCRVVDTDGISETRIACVGKRIP